MAFGYPTVLTIRLPDMSVNRMPTVHGFVATSMPYIGSNIKKYFHVRDFLDNISRRLLSHVWAGVRGSLVLLSKNLKLADF